MKKLVSILTAIMILAGTLSVFAIPASAARYPRAEQIYMYVRIDGIEGDSGSPFSYEHDRWIDVISYKQSFENIDGKQYTKLTFTHYLDCSSPDIQKYCREGTMTESADFHITATNLDEYEENTIYSLHLENVIITSVESTGAATDVYGNFTYLTETVTLLAETSTSAV